MANPWFRLYSEFADDPKVQMMSEQMQRRLVMLFCSRCKEETLRESERAFHWRITPAELEETKAVFMENGFIDADWNLTNWNRRQFLSDSSTERTRQYRMRREQVETSQERHTPSHVTAPDTEQIQNRTEKPARSAFYFRKPKAINGATVTCAIRSESEQENEERQQWDMWQGMSAAYRKANPWTGRKF